MDAYYEMYQDALAGTYRSEFRELVGTIDLNNLRDYYWTVHQMNYTEESSYSKLGTKTT